jgi:ergothioneine biosynthesis protein EgtB
MTGDDELLALFTSTRAATMRLAAPISVADHDVQSMADASPTKWHLAHTTWFFERNVLAEAIAGYAPVDPSYYVLFNSYYVSLGPSHPRAERGAITVPLADVHAYRATIEGRIREVLPTLSDELRDRVVLGCAHEEQHQELLLTDIKHALFVDGMRAYRELEAPASDDVSPDLDGIAHPGGLIEIGIEPGSDFTFDNEAPRHKVWLEPFALASRCVTNAEWDAFIADGGYRDARLWLSDGWAAAQAGGWQRPLYWTDDGREHTLDGTVRRRPGVPVCHVSYYEADAYARWAGARLPTEAEWEAVASEVAAEHGITGTFVDDGDGPLHPNVAGARGAQLFGDVWEWTASPYVPYPRFRPLAGALGEYNGKFMCNTLVLRGGSCLSPRRHLRASYRNYFSPATRWQMSGVRLARWRAE